MYCAVVAPTGKFSLHVCIEVSDSRLCHSLGLKVSLRVLKSRIARFREAPLYSLLQSLLSASSCGQGLTIPDYFKMALCHLSKILNNSRTVTALITPALRAPMW